MRNLILGLVLGFLASSVAQRWRSTNALPPISGSLTPVAYRQDAIAPDPAMFVEKPAPPPVPTSPPPAPAPTPRAPVSPPPAPARPKLYGCVDQWGVQWTHTDPEYLQRFVMERNATAFQQPQTQAAPFVERRLGLFGARRVVYSCPNGQCTAQ